jgi:hypothetical protein
MKLLLFIAFAAGPLVLERPIIFAETFTEGVRVSPETVTLKPVNTFGNPSARRKGLY